jgi:hypothetical protein
VILSAPILFSIVVVMFCAATWMGAKFFYAQQIKAKDAMIELLRTQIGRKEEISRHESTKQEAEMLKQRRLMDKQQQAAARRKDKN